jgi:hypothetical protein
MGLTHKGKPSGGCQDNIKIVLKGVRYVDWIHLAQDAVLWLAPVHTVTKCRSHERDGL